MKEKEHSLDQPAQQWSWKITLCQTMVLMTICAWLLVGEAGAVDGGENVSSTAGTP